MRVTFLAGAVGATVGVLVHGIVGHRRFVSALPALPATPTGDADISRRVFVVTWHLVTALFAVSAVTLALLGFAVIESPEAARVIGALFAASLAVGLGTFASRPGALLSPIPIAFAVNMTLVAAAAFVGAAQLAR